MKILGAILFSILRIIIVGGLTVYLLMDGIDGFLKPQYGSTNILIVVGMFIFFPIFFVLFVEGAWFSVRKGKKKKNNNKNSKTY